MNKILKYINILTLLFFVGLAPVNAVTKPSPDATLENISYVFYLYFDNGQLVGDRDFQVKFDVINEKYVPPSVSGDYKVEIYNFKSELVNTIQFDPRQGNQNFSQGKVQVKAPYVSNAIRASFSDSQNRQLMTIFLSAASLCNDDDFCSSSDGENENSCPNDCKMTGITPLASSVPIPVSDEQDFNMLLIYVVGGIGVVVAAWFFWKWRKKKSEGNFMPPPPSAAPPSRPTMPPPPVPPLS